MNISKELMLAILSMDAYNREYGAGIKLTGDKVGSATINDRTSFGIGQEQYQEWQDAGFYAVSYDIGKDGWEGLAKDATVISYRGTDQNLSLNPWVDEPGSDLWN